MPRSYGNDVFRPAGNLEFQQLRIRQMSLLDVRMIWMAMRSAPTIFAASLLLAATAAAGDSSSLLGSSSGSGSSGAVGQSNSAPADWTSHRSLLDDTRYGHPGAPPAIQQQRGRSMLRQYDRLTDEIERPPRTSIEVIRYVDTYLRPYWLLESAPEQSRQRHPATDQLPRHRTVYR